MTSRDDLAEWQESATTSSIPTEIEECAAFAAWCRRHDIVFCHIPNGGTRIPKEAAIFQMIGVMRGVPDYFVFLGRGMNVAIEMKRRNKGTVSIEQQTWLDYLQQMGWSTRVCWGAEEAIDFVMQVLDEFTPVPHPTKRWRRYLRKKKVEDE